MTGFRPEPIELEETLTDRVHNEIKMLIANHSFPVVQFTIGLRSTAVHGTEKAKTILIRPQTAGFEEARNRGCGGRLQQRSSWIWIAIIHFDKQVDVDSFENQLMRDPLRIARDAQLDQQIDITVADAEYLHPPEKQPSHGTRVTYRFQVDLTPL